MKDHIYEDCKATDNEGLNLSGNHGTMSLRCPKKKEINNKRKEKETRTNTYSNITKASTTHEIQRTGYTQEIQSKLFACMLRVHFMNIEDPGCYEQRNKTLKPNNLPTIKILRISKSDKITAKCLPNEEQRNEQTMNGKEDVNQPENIQRQEKKDKEEITHSGTSSVSYRMGKGEVNKKKYC